MIPLTKDTAAIVAGVGAAAVVGSIATIPEARWYASLDKPEWKPPDNVFGPAWTALYTDLAIVSARHIGQLRDEGREEEARSFAKALATNLVLNGTWSYFFFRLKSLPVSTGVAALLAMSSIDLVRRVGKTKKRRALALAPYGLWTSFATALTAEIWRRNGA